ncbi:MAG: hypothetical protein PF447_02280 [Spirochaetaceae bacterium]|jgi:hypothetical protein|nr:hypothetical protein [Spirochaetaceae bacterium]
MMNQTLFYVELRDNFRDKIQENRQPGFFEELENPYLQAAGRVSIHRKYPVVEVPTQMDIIILDDQGIPFRSPSSLYKYSPS